MVLQKLTRVFGRHGKIVAVYFKSFSTKTTHVPSLTGCAELAEVLQKPAWYEEFRVLDATWDLGDGDYLANHFQNRIKGSKFFSFEECRDKQADMPRMLPSAEDFADYVTNLGISNHHYVVVYDNHEKYGLYSSPRVWWMFRIFGHDRVSVLDGGFKKWVLDGYPIISGEYIEEEHLPAPTERFVATKKRAWMVKDFEFIKGNALSSHPVQVADARGKQRFLGLTAQGEIDPASGHIPRTYSVPFTGFLDVDTRTVLGKEKIKKHFDSNGVDLNKELVASCGSGITACVVALAAHHLADKDVAIYDGSWTEWKERGHDLISRGDEK